MASTTLNTFILPSPPFPVRAVEMKGSWDNFSKPYQLKKDGQTGHWRGCHAFENIVCDGTVLNQSTSRDGGLKMGGTYWYFYILHTIDGDLEYHNPVEASTASCPLLPGQDVNVLEVPMQANLIAGRNVSSTSIDSMVFTLDPKDKYLPPGVRRASTTSAIEQRKARLYPAPRIVHRSASTPLTDEVPPETSPVSRAGQSTSYRQRSLMSVFDRIRRTRSAGSNRKSGLSWPRKIFSRAERTANYDDVPEVPKLPSYLAVKDDDFQLPIQRPSTARSTAKFTAVPIVPSRGSVIVPPPAEEQQSSSRAQDSQQDGNLQQCYLDDFEAVSSPRYFTPLEQSEIGSFENQRLPSATTYVLPQLKANDSLESRVNIDLNVNRTRDTPEASTQTSVESPNAEELHPPKHSFDATIFPYPESSTFSYALSDDYSLDFSSNTTHSDPMSPLHLSQPETPIMGEFEDDFRDTLDINQDSQSYVQLETYSCSLPALDAPRPPSRAPPLPPPLAPAMTPQSALGGFQGYKLPSDDYGSVMTIRKLPSTTLKPSNGGSPYPQQGAKQDLVRTWNDGSEHLLDDLDYLGQLIN